MFLRVKHHISNTNKCQLVQIGTKRTNVSHDGWMTEYESVPAEKEEEEETCRLATIRYSTLTIRLDMYCHKTCKMTKFQVEVVPYNDKPIEYSFLNY
jgi:hypothetical protein